MPQGPALQPRSPTAAPQPPPGPARTTRGLPAAHRKRSQRVPTGPAVVGTACTNTTRGGESAPPKAAASSWLLPCFPPRPCRPRWGLSGSAWPPTWGLPPPSRLRRASPWCPAASFGPGLLRFPGLTFRAACAILFMRGPFRSFGGCPLGIHGRQENRSTERPGGFFMLCWLRCCRPKITDQPPRM